MVFYQELVRNGGFEEGTGADADYWEENGISRTTNQKHSGIYSVAGSHVGDYIDHFFDGLVDPTTVQISWYDYDDSFYQVAYRLYLICEDDSLYHVMSSSGDHTPWSNLKGPFGPFGAVGQLIKGIRFYIYNIQSGSLYIDDVSAQGERTGNYVGDLELLPEQIIDFTAEQVSNVHLPKWVNQNPDVDSSVWNKTKERLTYIMRLTDEQYHELRQTATNHLSCEFQDEIYDVVGYVWIETFNGVYDGNFDFDYPWKVTMTLIYTPQ